MVQLEKLGIPTVVLTTTEFEMLTRQAAIDNHLPEARILVTQHPLGGTDPEIVSSWARESKDILMRLLLT